MPAEERWTLNKIGNDLTAHIERETVMYGQVKKLYETVVTGNGTPALKTEVARHSDWINNVNKFIWIVITALLGQFIVMFCSFGVMIVILLAQNDILKP